jgi:hypothetical protein
MTSSTPLIPQTPTFTTSNFPVPSPPMRSPSPINLPISPQLQSPTPSTLTSHTIIHNGFAHLPVPPPSQPVLDRSKAALESAERRVRELEDQLTRERNEKSMLSFQITGLRDEMHAKQQELAGCKKECDFIRQESTAAMDRERSLKAKVEELSLMRDQIYREKVEISLQLQQTRRESQQSQSSQAQQMFSTNSPTRKLPIATGTEFPNAFDESDPFFSPHK